MLDGAPRAEQALDTKVRQGLEVPDFAEAVLKSDRSRFVELKLGRRIAKRFVGRHDRRRSKAGRPGAEGSSHQNVA